MCKMKKSKIAVLNNPIQAICSVKRPRKGVRAAQQDCVVQHAEGVEDLVRKTKTQPRRSRVGVSDDVVENHDHGKSGLSGPMGLKSLGYHLRSQTRSQMP